MKVTRWSPATNRPELVSWARAVPACADYARPAALRAFAQADVLARPAGTLEPDDPTTHRLPDDDARTVKGRVANCRRCGREHECRVREGSALDDAASLLRAGKSIPQSDEARRGAREIVPLDELEQDRLAGLQASSFGCIARVPSRDRPSSHLRLRRASRPKPDEEFLPIGGRDAIAVEIGHDSEHRPTLSRRPTSAPPPRDHRGITGRACLPW